jgi:hypothetical protein
VLKQAQGWLILQDRLVRRLAQAQAQAQAYSPAVLMALVQAW